MKDIHSKRTFTVRCASGLLGWRCRLQRNYRNFKHFAMYSDLYGLSQRLGFDSPEEAWKENPIIEGSVIPQDFRVVT